MGSRIEIDLTKKDSLFKLTGLHSEECAPLYKLEAEIRDRLDTEGKPITNKTVSAAFEIKERIDKNRSKTLKELQATREAKQKIITAEQQTTGVDFAGLKDMLTEINRKHKEKVVN